MDDVQPFKLSDMVATFGRDGSSSVLPSPYGPPVRIDGFTVGAPLLVNSPQHRGEMHPDGDELLYLVSGRVDLILELDGTSTTVGAERLETLQPGEAIIVPKGTWHRVEVREPSRLVHITPGPNGAHRSR